MLEDHPFDLSSQPITLTDFVFFSSLKTRSGSPHVGFSNQPLAIFESKVAKSPVGTPVMEFDVAKTFKFLDY